MHRVGAGLPASRAAEKGLDLAYLIAAGTPPAIAGDVTRLRQVLLNLLSFLEDGQERLAALRQALAETDVDAFRRGAHSLKSNAESLGATSLASLARELEARARAGSVSGVEDRLEPLFREYRRAADSLRELQRDLSA